jgi:hypothetical protein
VLKKKLGIAEAQGPGPSDLDNIKAFFAALLSPSKYEAL